MLAETIRSLDILSILMFLFGGLAIFLFGMDQMAEALKLVAGNSLKQILAKLTTNRFTGVWAGIIVTTIIQSSSVTTVLVVGFISARLLTLRRSIGIILGANIGTTITAQLIAFNITHYALILVAVGFALQFCFKRQQIRLYGNVIMGLGMIFFGMTLMSDGTSTLREYPPFVEMLARNENPLYGIALAALFTAIVQSSSATTALIVILAGGDLINLHQGIALMLGANIGTCITALLAALGKPREAVQAAWVHVLFNVGGVAIWIPFMFLLANVVERLGDDPRRQIANAHTLFNVSNTMIFIWFVTPMAWLVERVVPRGEGAEQDEGLPRYLDEIVLQTPTLALDAVRLELGRLGNAAQRMVQKSYSTVLQGTRRQLDSLEAMDNDVDALHGAIVTYLGRLSRGNLSERQSRQLQDFLAAANHMENIGDMIETNLVAVGRLRFERNVHISAATRQVLAPFHAKVSWASDRACAAIGANDRAIAAEVIAAKHEIDRLAHLADLHLSGRLSAEEPNRLATFRLETEIVEYLKRVYYFAKRIAKIVVAADESVGSEQTEQAEPMAAPVEQDQ